MHGRCNAAARMRVLQAHPTDPPPSHASPPTPSRQIDPKTAAKAKAAESRQQNKAAKMAKEASGMRKLSAFFTTKPAKS